MVQESSLAREGVLGLGFPPVWGCFGYHPYLVGSGPIFSNPVYPSLHFHPVQARICMKACFHQIRAAANCCQEHL